MRRLIAVICGVLILTGTISVLAQVKLPPVTEKVLDNGLECVVIENHELPIVSMRLVIKSGAAFDPPGKAGLANLTAELTRMGTKKRQATEIAEAIDFVGGKLGTSVNLDASNLTCTVLLKHFDVGLDILSDIALNPTFAVDEFERQKEKAIAAARQSKDDPSNLCEQAFNRVLFGAHPYSEPAEGTETSLQSLTVEDVRNFYHTYYRPNNAIFVIAGDVNPAKIMKAAQKAFGRWQKQPIPPLSVAPVVNPIGIRIVLVDKPDVTQTYIRFGHLGITRRDPDYYPLLLMNYILGSTFTSRLNQKVRVERGLTYDIRTQNEWHVMPGAYYCNTYTETDSTMAAFECAIDVIKSIQQAEVSDIEFDEARNFYTGYYPMTLETPDQVAAEIIKVKLYGLPVSYIKDFTTNINRVTKADILRVARQRWDTNNMILAVVANGAQVEEKLRPLGQITKMTMDQF